MVNKAAGARDSASVGLAEFTASEAGQEYVSKLLRRCVYQDTPLLLRAAVLAAAE